jgi:hypothetical protein
MVKFLHIITYVLIAAIVSCCSTPCPLTQDYLELRGPIVSVKEIEPDSMFSKAWLLWVEQPIDHHNPGKGTFKQRVWLSYRSPEAPVVFVTEGYMAPRNHTTELAKIVKGNQVIVEHRFFDRSVPDSIDWQYLTIEQAAMDHHRIIKMLKKYYKGTWISTGISKGGQTAIIHRALFPKDVDITVPYVAPFNLAMEDKRLLTFFDHVGTAEQRKKIQDFQKEVLKRKDELMPLFDEFAEQKKYTYRIGKEKAYELSVLEYPFSLWQWGGPVDEIPEPDASAEVLFSHLQQCSDFGYFSDQQWEKIGPFFYQAYKELGYYSYITTPLKKWLTEIKEDTVSNRFMAPKVNNLTFDKQAGYDILKKLKKADPEMIILTGENDPWGATSLNPEGFKHILKVVKPGGCHRTRINNLPDSLRTKVIEQLNKWVD